MKNRKKKNSFWHLIISPLSKRLHPLYLYFYLRPCRPRIYVKKNNNIIFAPGVKSEAHQEKQIETTGLPKSQAACLCGKSKGLRGLGFKFQCTHLGEAIDQPLNPSKPLISFVKWKLITLPTRIVGLRRSRLKKHLSTVKQCRRLFSVGVKHEHAHAAVANLRNTSIAMTIKRNPNNLWG